VLADTEGLVRVGPFKVLVDGSLNTRTAYCFDPYPGAVPPDDHGLLTVPPEQLEPMMRRATEHGLRCAIHAIGDQANSLVLDAFERVGARGTIEHAQLVGDADFTRFARLGVVASVQPEHAVEDRDVADRHWVGRTGRAFAFRTLLDSGATLALGSDAPVAPLDPWVSIAAAVRRTADERPGWHAEQSITAHEALCASTHGRPLVVEGDRADLVVLDQDPLDAPASGLATMAVSGTMIDGRWTWQAL
jgi:predicted amidohydrolase YtcJ